jgi:hypothetical protein
MKQTLTSNELIALLKQIDPDGNHCLSVCRNEYGHNTIWINFPDGLSKYISWTADGNK